MTAHVPNALIGGRYRLVSLAGRGGMAEVWRADLLGSEGFQRPVALKRILKALVHLSDHRAMFVEEAQLTALLDHPNIVQVHDFGEDADGLYIVMEWVEGLSLRDLLDVCAAHDAQVSPALAAAIGIEVLRGLEAAHENTVTDPDGTVRASPIIHRDVSPSNVMLSVRGVVKLADFGLARALHRASMQRLTPAGVVKGKLSYMAPEVVQGKPASPQSDLYSTGVMLWEIIAGRRLFDRKSDYDIVMSLVKGDRAPAIRSVRPDVPPVLAEVVDRALDTNPEKRYANAESFARALSDALRTVPERTDKSRMAREFASAMTAWRSMKQRERSGSLRPTAVTAAPPERVNEHTGPVLETEEGFAAPAVPADLAAQAAAEEPSAGSSGEEKPRGAQGAAPPAEPARPGRPQRHPRPSRPIDPDGTLSEPIVLGALDGTGHVRIPPTPQPLTDVEGEASTKSEPPAEKTKR